MNKIEKISLSRSNVLARGMWTFVYLFLFRPTPRVFHAWRCFLLRMFGAKIGKSVKVYQSAKVWAPWNLRMEDFSVLGDYVDCYCVASVHIKDHAVVSQYSFLCTASRDFSSTDKPLVAGEITIGESAWVTADVFIGPGVCIGARSVITARSSVFKDIGDDCVASGNPAEVSKQRVVR